MIFDKTPCNLFQDPDTVSFRSKTQDLQMLNCMPENNVFNIGYTTVQHD